jgi:hypothetical protein
MEAVQPVITATHSFEVFATASANFRGTDGISSARYFGQVGQPQISDFAVGEEDDVDEMCTIVVPHLHPGLVHVFCSQYCFASQDMQCRVTSA